ncbi:MAG: Pyridoxal 4-dehydrogenase [Nocardioides sp.]|nr:Pyridoxal 4-dehydrogenase [Nocardioides sp.]
MGFGSVALGNMGRAMPADEARAVVNHAWDAGVRLFDTAPMYGHGLAEYRLGGELFNRDRDECTLVTKVGRRLVPAPQGSFDPAPWVSTPSMALEYDYSYDGVLRQVEDSLQRMGTDRFDVLLVHDVDRFTHGDEQPAVFEDAVDGAFRALVSLREQGVVRAIGIGVNEVDVCVDAISAVDIDCVLIAGALSLLDQQAAVELFPLCLERGVAVLNGRVFGSGILATGARPDARFEYSPAPASVVERVRAMETVCREHGVPLGAAAVQFAASHPAVTNVCVGFRTVAQQAQCFAWLEHEIPDDVWRQLAEEGHLRSMHPG